MSCILHSGSTVKRKRLVLQVAYHKLRLIKNAWREWEQVIKRPQAHRVRCVLTRCLRMLQSSAKASTALIEHHFDYWHRGLPMLTAFHGWLMLVRHRSHIKVRLSELPNLRYPAEVVLLASFAVKPNHGKCAQDAVHKAKVHHARLLMRRGFVAWHNIGLCKSRTLFACAASGGMILCIKHDL
jgi:hypothetical protein